MNLSGPPPSSPPPVPGAQVRLRIGEYHVGEMNGNAPGAAIHGLGSCLAIALFDPHARLYGLAHCLLPETGQQSSSRLPVKFVDSGIATLTALLEVRGAKRGGMMAKLAGGAAMFQVLGREVRPHVGERNIETAHRQLRTLGIPLAAEDVGGAEGRSVQILPAQAGLQVTTLRGGSRVL